MPKTRSYELYDSKKNHQKLAKYEKSKKENKKNLY